MAKVTSTYNLLKTYEEFGYKTNGRTYVCPDCLKRVPKDRGETLRRRASKKVFIFTKEGKPSVAACPCGFRRVSKPEPTKETMCAAITGKGTRCKNKALPGSHYCHLPAHQAKAKQAQQLPF